MEMKVKFSFLTAIILAGFIFAGPAWAVDPNLIAHWKLDEGAGTAANDSAGANNGTVYGAVWTTGRIDGALSFDGVNDYVDCGNNPSLDVGAGPFTLAAWVKGNTANGQYQMIVGHYCGGHPGNYQALTLVLEGNGHGRIGMRDNSLNLVEVVGTAILTDGEWHLITGVRSPDVLYLYVDGLQEGTPVDASGVGDVVGAQIWGIGAVKDHHDIVTNYLCGTVDDARIYNRALSAEEIEDLYLEAFSPAERATAEVQGALDEKLEAVEKIDSALEKENKALDAVNELLKSGDYGDLTKNDVLRAEQEIRVAVVQQQTSKRTLEATIERLEDALSFLGYELPPEPPMPDSNLPNLIAHWKLDEGSGTVVNDSAGANNGTVYGAAWTDGKISGAMSFDGVDDYIEGSSSPFDFADTTFTASAWFKTTGTQGMIVTEGGCYGGWALRTGNISVTETGLLMVMLKESGSLNAYLAKTATSYNNDTWYHVAAVITTNTSNPAGNHADIYVDGLIVPTTELKPYSYAPATPNWRIGARYDVSPVYFNGKIDDVRIYTRALSAQEIQDLYLEAFSPAERAIAEIQGALDEKLEAVGKINSALEKENKALDAVNELLKSGDYGDLTKNDILRAKQEIRVAMVQQETSRRTLEATIERLEDALTFLGYEPPPEPPTPDPNLIAHWKLDETSGTVAYDSAGTNNGTVYGAAWTAGQFAGALSFDGDTDYVDVPDSDDFVPPVGTISVWVKLNTWGENNFGRIMCHLAGPVGNRNGFDWNVRGSDHNFGFCMYNGTSSCSVNSAPESLTLNNWYHLTVVWNGTNMIGYVNGSQSAVSTQLTSPGNPAYDLFIGRVTDTSLYDFNGAIDDVRIYNRALTAEDIQKIYQGLL